MVIALIGIVSVVAFVGITSFQAQHLYAAADRIAGDLRYAKNMALTSTSWHGIGFSIASESLIDPAKPGAAYAFSPPPSTPTTTVTTTTLPPVVPPSSLVLESNQYAIFETDGSTDTIIERPGDPGEDYVVDLSDDYQGISITNVDIDGIGRVEFSPLGVPYTDKNANPISSIGIITLSSDDSSITVRIAPQSGRIYIE